MRKFEEENGVTLPAIVRLKGTDLALPLHRVVTFTGTRFLRGVSSAAEGLTFPEDELEIATAVFSMMVDRPPESITVEQLRGVLRMCQFCLADTLLGGLPAYLEGAVRSSDAVCILLSRVDSLICFSLSAPAQSVVNVGVPRPPGLLRAGYCMPMLHKARYIAECPKLKCSTVECSELEC